jgi:hypothetical protein
MSSAFPIFDLMGRDPALKRQCDARVSSIQNLMTVKKRSGLSFEKRVNRLPGVKLRQRRRAHHPDFVTKGELLATRRCAC